MDKAQALCGAQVMPGDICVLGSDGLFDNVSEEELLEEVSLRPAAEPSVAVMPQHVQLSCSLAAPPSLGRCMAVFRAVISGARMLTLHPSPTSQAWSHVGTNANMQSHISCAVILDHACCCDQVGRLRQSGAGPNAIARQLTKVAFYNSMDRSAPTCCLRRSRGRWLPCARAFIHVHTGVL